jgi:Dynein attachment factor N-terminus
MASSAISASGHLNAHKLQQELSSALAADDKRKKVDDMKKRAIHVAGSYDEFRHMVSCAELKTVRWGACDCPAAIYALAVAAA